jgi:hypothetical protein
VAVDAHELYGLALDRFVAERSALVKKLRAEGRRDEAGQVAKLAKPSVAAWAVNQLVRTQSRGVTRLFDAGDALRRAHAAVVAGQGDARTLRKATEGERAAVAALTDAARGLLDSDGHGLSQTTVERVADTLHAAALDDAARAAVSDGCLTRELRHVGLGQATLVDAAAPRAARPPRARDDAKSSPGSAPSDDDLKAARREREARAARERARRLEAARSAEADARRAVEERERELQLAQERRDDAAEALETAEHDLRAARKQASEAARAHRRAQQALQRI